jgi:hypothetical protein
MLATAGTLVLEPSASASAESHREVQQIVRVVGNGSRVTLDHSSIQTGSIRFQVSTTNPANDNGGGSDISMFQPHPGKSLGDVFAALAEMGSQSPATAAKGTRDLVRDVEFYGLVDVLPGFPEAVTEHLEPGTFYLIDLGNQPTGQPTVTVLTVGSDRSAFEQDSDLVSQRLVRTTSADRFVARSLWPHAGTYTFRNVSDTIHFIAMIPVKDGTTDAQVQAAFSAPPSSSQNGPPPFFRSGPSAGSDVVSPGRSVQVSYNLPPGSYVLACFISDDKTGMPHAIMGMHKVIHLT